MTAPERIYLQWIEDDAAPYIHEGVTWCADKIEDDDVEYVRADVARATPADHIGDAAEKVDADSVPVAVTEAMAEKIGESGTPHSEAERKLYEAYCKGHCWQVGPWNGTEYYEMLDRVRFAMWRDRAALCARPQPPQKVSDSVRDARLFDILMRRNIEITDEAYLALRVVGVPPSEEEFLAAMTRALDAAPPQKPGSEDL